MEKLSNKKALTVIKKAAREGRIQFATADKLSSYAVLLHDFMEHIIGCSGYWLSDYSTIDEYEFGQDNQSVYKKYAQKIRERYGVQMKIGTKKSYYMCDIMERLAGKIAELKDE